MASLDLALQGKACARARSYGVQGKVEQTQSQRGVRPLSSVLKTLDLLAQLGKLDQAVRLSELVRLTGEQRATVYQRLLTLMHGNWVEQTPDGAYRLTLLATRMGEAALRQASLGERSVAVMRQLVDEVNEAASLAVQVDHQACIVRRIEAEVVVRAQVRVGTLLSLANSSSGRVLTAFMPAEARAQLAQAGAALPPAEVLEETARLGYAISSGIDTPGARSIAAPVFDAQDSCRFALSIVAPVERFEPERYVGPVLAAAARLTEQLRGEET